MPRNMVAWLGCEAQGILCSLAVYHCTSGLTVLDIQHLQLCVEQVTCDCLVEGMVYLLENLLPEAREMV